MPTGLQRAQRVKTSGHAIHVTSWDMMVYRYLTDLRQTGDHVTPLPLYPTVPAFYSLTMGSEVDLLQYCASHLTRAVCPCNIPSQLTFGDSSRVCCFELTNYIYREARRQSHHPSRPLGKLAILYSSAEGHPGIVVSL